ncbi:response regulator transcription factor [Paenalkalicoccus suaedae]|uniref:Heme response regulator HssR n=1 Tax=Paenalkalicoccus suaedae TaxID=2592382 RepID=A0A859FH15_9BACI|nr:response regulator transcription factor [Paenalkalicoccus suaedae]QKS72663.1 response regulator transcription factor [Paenalkalicoccus suaedae]
MITILLVEDDKSLRRLIHVFLKKQGYTVLEATNGLEALALLEDNHVDLLLCDIMMPEMDGISLMEAWQDAKMTTPVLVVTAKEDMETMERSFRAGGDDYIVKPIKLQELALRIQALLRRARITAEKRITIGTVIVDYESLSIEAGSNTIFLPKKEFYLLYKLLSYPRRVFSRVELLEEIWGLDADVDSRTVDSHVKKIRRRTEEIAEFEIVTVRGLGYKAELCV